MSIVNIPIEILTQISEYCDINTLQSLRLSHSVLQKSAAPILFKTLQLSLRTGEFHLEYPELAIDECEEINTKTSKTYQNLKDKLGFKYPLNHVKNLIIWKLQIFDGWPDVEVMSKGKGGNYDGQIGAWTNVVEYNGGFKTEFQDWIYGMKGIRRVKWYAEFYNILKPPIPLNLDDLEYLDTIEIRYRPAEWNIPFPKLVSPSRFSKIKKLKLRKVEHYLTLPNSEEFDLSGLKELILEFDIIVFSAPDNLATMVLDKWLQNSSVAISPYPKFQLQTFQLATDVPPTLTPEIVQSHFQNLEHLTLFLYKDPFVGVESFQSREFWSTLQSSNVRLKSLKCQTISKSLLEYLSSYSNTLETLDLKPQVHHSATDPLIAWNFCRDLGKYFWQNVIPQHTKSLRILKLGCQRKYQSVKGESNRRNNHLGQPKQPLNQEEEQNPNLEHWNLNNPISSYALKACTNLRILHLASEYTEGFPDILDKVFDIPNLAEFDYWFCFYGQVKYYAVKVEDNGEISELSKSHKYYKLCRTLVDSLDGWRRRFDHDDIRLIGQDSNDDTISKRKLEMWMTMTPFYNRKLVKDEVNKEWRFEKFKPEEVEYDNDDDEKIIGGDISIW